MSSPMPWNNGEIPVVSSTEYIAPGFSIEATFPLIRARRVYGMNILKDMKIAARDFFGGRSKQIENVYETMELEVLSELQQQAIEKGCHALVRVQLQHGVIERGSSCLLSVIATATPVTLKHSETERSSMT